MNKFVSKLWLLMTIMLVIPALTSCSDDDDDDKTTDYAQIIKGTYSGSIAAFGNPIPGTYEIVMDYKSMNVINLKWNGSIPTQGAIPGLPATLTLNVNCDAPVTLVMDKYHFAGTTTVNLGTGMENCPVVVSGDIDKSNNAKINIVVTIGAIPVSVMFDGKK